MATTTVSSQGIYQGQQPPQFPPPTPWQHYQPRMQYSNTKKMYNNTNYCWSHGHDMEDFHTSAPCPAPKVGHQPMATKINTMNGSRRAAHKYWQGPQQTKAPRAPER
eukprot:2652846-Ditylum_brightwellii.AAC.1